MDPRKNQLQTSTSSRKINFEVSPGSQTHDFEKKTLLETLKKFKVFKTKNLRKGKPNKNLVITQKTL